MATALMAGTGSAFVTLQNSAPTVGFQGSSHVPVKQVPVEEPRAINMLTMQGLTGASTSAAWRGGAMLCSIAALAFVGGQRKKQRSASRIARRVEQRMSWDSPEDAEMVANVPRSSLEYRAWVNLRKRAKRVGKTRFYNQKLILQDEGIKEYHVHHASGPLGKYHNLYKGEESRADNPFFPAASMGWMEMTKSGRPKGKKAMMGGEQDAPSMGASVASPSAAAGFAGSSLRLRFSLGSRGATSRSAVVMKAHKKAASATKHQGRKQKPTHRGVQRKGGHGSAVKVGTVLVRQLGTHWRPGANVIRTKSNDLMATRDGIVQWRGAQRNEKGVKKYMNLGLQEVFVVPWEFVNERCVFGPNGTLLPKAYEPWMGVRNPDTLADQFMERGQDESFKVQHLNGLREEWLKTDEGKAWKEKKDEKKQKQKEIQARIKAYKESKKSGQKQPEMVGRDSDSESEA
mmetsp:Transcript_43837/g.103654  ORF Transcript_43837/g.103654 Transcript_43837/m.103654 type:complete len:458 (-) Transcript_43837:115-1488(-)